MSSLRGVATASGLVLLLAWSARQVAAQKHPWPQPKVVEPGGHGQAPSDAIVLFNGRDLTGWVRRDGSPARCTASDGVMVCRTGAGHIYSTEKFRDAQIHLEFLLPAMPERQGQLRGNSGVYLHGCYEIQILDSYRNPTYPEGAAAAIYGVSPPLVIASRPPHEWQSYDLVFRAPRCDANGALEKPGYLTLFHNGVLVQDHVEITRRGAGCRDHNLCEPGPLMLQDHSGFKNAPDTTMKFRNLWLRRLEEAPSQP